MTGRLYLRKVDTGCQDTGMLVQTTTVGVGRTAEQSLKKSINGP